MFDQLHQAGVSIALDDFGSGYSSIAYLRKLSFNRIKIDRSLTKALLVSDMARSMIQATGLIANGVSRVTNQIETVSNSLGRSYTLSTDAIWIISTGVVSRDLAGGQLIALPVDVSGTKGPIGITTRSGGDVSLTSRAMLDCIRQAVTTG